MPHGTSPMTPADRLLVSLVFLLIAVSIVATLPQTLQLLPITQGVQPIAGQLGLRWLREGMLAAIVLIGTTVTLAKRRVVIDAGTARATLFIMSWVLIVAFWSITDRKSVV